MNGRTFERHTPGYDLMRELAEHGEAGFLDEFGPRIGRRVRTIRELSGLTPGELAGCLGREVGWVEDIEAGRIMPSVPEAIVLACSLGVSLSVLIEAHPVKADDYRLAVAADEWLEIKVEMDIERDYRVKAESAAKRLRKKVRDLNARLRELEASAAA